MLRTTILALLALVSTLLLLFELVLLARVAVDGSECWPRRPVGSHRRAVCALCCAGSPNPCWPRCGRKLPPLRLGSVSLDLSVTLVLLAVIVLRSVLP